MDTVTVGIIGVILMIVFLFAGFWVAVAMGLAAALGIAYIAGTPGVMSVFGTQPFETVTNYSLAVIPLFVLMGEFAFHAGLSEELYNMMYRLFGRMEGGLAIATVWACAAFGAVAGETSVCVATIGKSSVPQMRKYGYDTALTAGSIAAGGTLGIMIPPSVMFVVYGIFAEQPIGPLFMSGIVPGVIQAIMYMVTIYVLCKRNPHLGPSGTPFTFMEKLSSLKGSWVVLVLFVIVVGGMYIGIFTPTEAAGIGAFGCFAVVAAKKRLTGKTLIASLVDTTKTSSMIFIMIIGAMFLNSFLALSKIPYDLANLITTLEVSKYVIIGGMTLLYIILGCFMGGLILIVATVPIFLPLVIQMGFHPIWYGVFMVTMVQIGSITPPVGMSLFIMKGVAPDISANTVNKGVTPFVICDVFRAIITIAFPQLIMFVPHVLYPKL